MTDTHSEASQTEPHGAVSQAVSTVRDAAQQALDTTRSTASDAARKASGAIEQNPLALLGAGLVLGAIAGALLPRSEREAELIGPVGKRLADSATAAAHAALDTGKTELSAIGLNRDTLQSQGKSLLDGVLGALSEAAKAGAQAGTGKGE